MLPFVFLWLMVGITRLVCSAQNSYTTTKFRMGWRGDWNGGAVYHERKSMDEAVEAKGGGEEKTHFRIDMVARPVE